MQPIIKKCDTATTDRFTSLPNFINNAKINKTNPYEKNFNGSGGLHDEGYYELLRCLISRLDYYWRFL